jgi:hypothetical protein
VRNHIPIEAIESEEVNRGRSLDLQLARRFAALAIVATVSWGSLSAQTSESMTALASRSSIIVLGTVTRAGASEESLVAPSSATAVIKIRRMYAGTEFAGDQAGHTATVILSKPGDVKEGSELLFFGNPRFIGKTITIADVGELPVPRIKEGEVSAELTQGIQARRDAPVRARLELASVVFRGKVESVRAPEGTKENELRQEHDPEWQVAMVRVTSPTRGAESGAVVPVIFPASRDIMWFNSPKLHVGEDVLILGHRPQEDELRVLRNTPAMRVVEEEHAVVVSQPYDVLPPSDEKRLAALSQKEVK